MRGGRGGRALISTPPGVERRADSGLLRSLLERHLEPGYEAAARRRDGMPASARERRLGLSSRIVVLLAVGVLLATAYVQASARAPQSARTRAGLASDARQRAALTDRLQREAAALRARLSAERAKALASSTAGGQATARLRDLEVATSLLPSHGPGLLVTVGDAAARRDPVTGTPVESDPTSAGHVQDRDLAEIANGLWAAGAEAIAISGQRLSPTSTIRSAGGAVLIDFRPVSSPYRISAIGNAGRMQVSFTDSAIARAFASFVQLYSMTFSIHRAGRLDLPAAPAAVLRYAIPGGAR